MIISMNDDKSILQKNKHENYGSNWSTVKYPLPYRSKRFLKYKTPTCTVSCIAYLTVQFESRSSSYYLLINFYLNYPIVKKCSEIKCAVLHQNYAWNSVFIDLTLICVQHNHILTLNLIALVGWIDRQIDRQKDRQKTELKKRAKLESYLCANILHLPFSNYWIHFPYDG